MPGEFQRVYISDQDGTVAHVDTKGIVNAQATYIVDSSGVIIEDFGSGSGGGTQYTEGDVDASITGNAILWEADTDTLSTVSNQSPLPIEVKNSTLTITGSVSATQSGTWNITNVSGTVSLPTGAATAANQSTIIGHVDGIEGLLTTIDTDTGVIAGAVSGSEMQVDVITMPTTTVQATNLDIRDLTSASDSILIYGSDDGGTTKRIIKTDSSGSIQVDFENTTIAVTQSGTWDEVGINDSGNSITVDNGGTFAVQVSSALPSGTNNIGDVDVLSVVPGTGATNLGKAEDDVHGSGDVGVMALGVRNNSATTPTAYGADGDYVPGLPIDSAGRIFVNAAVRSSGGNSTEQDLNTDTQSTSVFANRSGSMNFWYTGSVWARARGDATDGLLVNLGSNNDVVVTNAGTFAVQESGSALTALQLIDDTVYVDDADWTDSTSKHLLVGGLYQSTPQTVTDGDVAPFNITANGALHVSDAGGSLTVDNAGLTELAAAINSNQLDINIASDSVGIGGGTQYTLGTDTYTEATSVGTLMGAVRNDTLAALANTDNEIAPLQVNASGALFVDVADGGVLESALDGIEGVLGTIDADTGNIATSVGTLDNAVATISSTDVFRVAIFDDSDAQITSFGGGVQYTEGDTDTTITGTALMFESNTGTNALSVVSSTAALPVRVVDALGNQFFDQASKIGGFTSDNVDASTANGLRTGAWAYWFDGTTWDRARGDSTDGLLVNLGSNNDVINAGTFAVQESGSALTALQLIDDVVYVDDADWTDNTSKHALVGGVYQSSPHTVTDGDVTPFLTDANGRLIVAATDNGGALTVDNGGTFAVQVSSALPSGTNAIGKLAANSGVDIGDVDVTSIVPGTGATNLGKAEDAGHTTGDVGVMALAVRQDTLAALAGTTADYTPLQVTANGAVYTTHGNTTIGHGVTTVTTAGTDVALAASTACREVTIQSQTDNTNYIAVGATGVDATVATGTGIMLSPGESITLQIDNLADVFIDSLVNGEGVRYVYLS